MFRHSTSSDSCCIYGRSPPVQCPFGARGECACITTNAGNRSGSSIRAPIRPVDAQPGRHQQLRRHRAAQRQLRLYRCHQPGADQPGVERGPRLQRGRRHHRHRRQVGASTGPPLSCSSGAMCTRRRRAGQPGRQSAGRSRRPVLPACHHRRPEGLGANDQATAYIAG